MSQSSSSKPFLRNSKAELRPAGQEIIAGPLGAPYCRGFSWSIAFYFCSLAVAIVAGLALRGTHPGSLGNLANFMGPLAEDLASGRGYVVCGSGMGAAGNIICFHANRMPLPPWLLAGLIRLFGNSYILVELGKMALVLVPIAAAVNLAVSRACSFSRNVQLVLMGLLFFALVLPIQLIDVINMQVEEGYSFCLLSYALAILLFGVQARWISWTGTLFFSMSVLGIYLTKSSMIACAGFLVIAFWMEVQDGRKRIAVLLIVLCGPLGWGLFAAHASGRFTVGTSLDGINLHKGNYAEFPDRYPPAPGVGLDQYDEALSRGTYFSDEWKFNAYHMHAAEAYMRAHPARTLRGTLWKAEVFFLSLRKIGSEQYVGWLGAMTTAGMVLFRLLLWSACGVAIWLLTSGTRRRHETLAMWPSIIYLGTVFAVAAPYLAGFALTRHASVLSFPSALFLSWFVVNRARFGATTRASSGWLASPCAAPAQVRSGDQ